MLPGIYLKATSSLSRSTTIKKSPKTYIKATWIWQWAVPALAIAVSAATKTAPATSAATAFL
jgi:hypothetical protein